MYLKGSIFSGQVSYSLTNNAEHVWTSQNSAGASIYMAAVMEYKGTEILELAGNAPRYNKKTMIIPRNLQITIGNYEELTNCWLESSLPRAVSSPTSMLFSCPRSRPNIEISLFLILDVSLNK